MDPQDFVLEIGLAFESIPTLPPRHFSAMASELMASHGSVLHRITDVEIFPHQASNFTVTPPVPPVITIAQSPVRTGKLITAYHSLLELHHYC